MCNILLVFLKNNDVRITGDHKAFPEQVGTVPKVFYPMPVESIFMK